MGSYKLDPLAPLVHLPVREPRFVETCGRSGDWREPLAFGLASPSGLASAAARAGLSEGLSLTLLVERELVLADVAGLGRDRGRARTLLNHEASVAPSVVFGPGHVNASYAHSLDGHEYWGPRSPEGVFSLPARLLERADRKLVEATLNQPLLEGALEEALGWERAALQSGRLMGEWALLVLLTALPGESASWF